MQIHQIKSKFKRKRSIKVGRGGKRGKTSGRGTKGQNSRTGRKIRPEIRDVIKRIPKLRGHGKNRAESVNDSVVKPKVINLGDLDKVFLGGEVISPKTLAEKGLLKLEAGKLPKVKILGTGEVTKKFTLEDCLVSEGAKAKLIKAQGTVK